MPRLNLGVVKLPTPGQRNAPADDYILNGGTLLVEYLSQTDVMPRDEAEELVSRQLLHYLMHRGGFQIHRDRAVALLRDLESTTNQAVHIESLINK